jgi:ABC-2 type transport system permease protein
VIFGNLVGRRIGEMGGFQYMEFIVPGLIMMAVIQNSYSNVVSSFFSHKFQHSVEELLVAPVPNYVILCGFIAGGMARGLAVGTIVTFISLLFADLEIQNLFITITVVLLTSIVFALAGFINALFANSFDDISIIPTFVLTPLI